MMSRWRCLFGRWRGDERFECAVGDVNATLQISKEDAWGVEHAVREAPLTEDQGDEGVGQSSPQDALSGLYEIHPGVLCVSDDQCGDDVLEDNEFCTVVNLGTNVFPCHAACNFGEAYWFWPGCEVIWKGHCGSMLRRR